MSAVTKVSTKGQVVLPKAVRDKGFPPGTVVEVIDHGPGRVTLVARRKDPFFPRTTLDQVAGIIKYDGPPLTIEDMEVAIDEAMAERWARKSGTAKP